MKNPKVKYWISLLSLGYMGGTIYLLPYIRYAFYTQMQDCMQITNTQIGLLSTIFAVIYGVSMLPGGMIADHFDAKKIIIFSVGSTTILTFIHAIFAHSYGVALVVWAGMGVSTGFAYWPALQKYILSLGNKEEQGRSYGRYYLINGLSGALGNAIPLWVASSLGLGYQGAIFAVGIMTAIATVLVIVFLESEEDKKARGVIMETEDEPPHWDDIKYVVKWPGTWLFFLISPMGMYVLYSQTSYFTPYLTDVVGIDPTASSAVAIVRTYVTMIMAPLGGWLADKVFKSTSKFLAFDAGIAGLLVAGVFLFGPDSNPTFVAVYTIMPSLIIQAGYAVRYSITRELHIPNTMMGTMVGLMSLIPYGDGIIPPLFGHWLDKYGLDGYTIILWFLVASAALVVIGCILVHRHDLLCQAGKRDIRGNVKKQEA